MKLEITVFKETRTHKSGKGFAGRELLAEGLLGVQYVGRLSGLAQGEVSGKTVPELMGRIKEAVGTISRKEDRELQFRFEPAEGQDVSNDMVRVARKKLDGSEISEVFKGIEKVLSEG